MAKLHLALNGLPEFNGLERPAGRMIIALSLDAIEFAFDAAKYGDSPENPVLEIVVPSLHEPSLAPVGQHLLSAHVMYVPYRLKGGWTEAARRRICERAIDTIARHAPRIREQIIAQEFLTPADLEREFLVTGGHWHHTEFALDQLLMMRPTYEAAQYATPIPGLYLCGAGVPSRRRHHRPSRTQCRAGDDAMSCDDFALQKVSLLWVGVPWRISQVGVPSRYALALVGVPNDRPRASGCPQRPVGVPNDRCDDFALQKVSLLWVGVPWRNDRPRASGCPQRPVGVPNDRSNDRSQRPRWVSGCYPPLLPQ